MSLTDEAELKGLREVLDSDEEYYMESEDAERREIDPSNFYNKERYPISMSKR